MEIDNIKNEGLKEAIVQCVERNQVCLKFFAKVSALFVAVDVVCIARKIERRDLDRFIFGALIVTPLAINNPKYEDEAEILTRPVLNILKSYLKNEYADYLVNTATLSASNELAKQITHRGLLTFIKDKDLTPLTNQDIEDIEVFYRQELSFFT
jgi:hypothetical protein